MANHPVKLKEYEMLWGAFVGIRRRIEAIVHNMESPEKVDPEKQWAIDVEGATAEYAAAKWLGITWDGSVNTFQLPDIGEFGVRRTVYSGGCLIIRPKDFKYPELYQILVTGSMPDYNLRGFLKNKDGMKDEWLKNPHDLGPCYMVPQKSLNQDLLFLREIAHRVYIERPKR